MYYIPMRLRVLIAVTVLLTPLAIWRILYTRNAPPSMSPEETSIREDRINDNVDGLVEKINTLPTRYAKMAVRALGTREAKSLAPLKKILSEDKRPKIKQQAAQAMAQAIRASGQIDKPLGKEMTTALARALTTDKAPEVRASAASALGHLYDYHNMESLLKAMNDENLAVRRRAFEAVSRIFGRRYEFNPNSTPEKRKIVIKVISEAWETYKDHVGRYIDDRRKSSKP